MSAALELAWESVRAAPDDVRRVDVLTDHLLEVGDPFGTHLRLSLELLRRPAEVGLKLEVLRSQQAIEQRFAGHAITWTPLGLMEGLRYTRREGGSLARILAEPAAQAVRFVRWWSLDDPHTVAALEHLPPTVVELELVAAGERMEPVPLAALVARLPQLMTLSAQGQLSLDGLKHPALRSLTWSAFVRPGDEVVAELATLRLPALRGLVVGLRAGPSRWPLDLLSGHTFPSLKALALAGSLWPQHLEDLAACGLVRQLEELQLGVDPLPAFEQILTDAADRFDHLRRFTPPRPA
jgi:hypothetical protein